MLGRPDIAWRRRLVGRAGGAHPNETGRSLPHRLPAGALRRGAFGIDAETVLAGNEL